MTRLFLAAGVAALAISAPAAARPGGSQDHNDRQKASVQRGGGGQRAHATERRSQPRQSAQMQRGGGQRAERAHRFAAQRPQHVERQANRAERRQARTERVAQRPAHTERAHTRQVARQDVRENRVRAQNRMAERQQVRANRVEKQNRMADRQQFRADRQARNQDLKGQRQELRAERQIRAQDLRTARNVLRADRVANVGAFRESRLARLDALTPRTRIIAPARALSFVGQPLSTVSNVVPLAVLPAGVSYLYPDTPDYYYRYGDGYLYQVDRGSNLIAALLPLLAGGYMPGTYLPNYYMSSYVPSYWGMNSFYPTSYGYDYGYGYSNLCNRYANGVIYQVNCSTGLIQDVVPLYAGGYGVGQMLPSAYSYYNVPYQYRSLYYDTPDYNYWYAPGAIYQYDRDSSLITSVAALLSPGFTIGQPLPIGYNTYNVPYAYRATYYDTPNAWYRYNNGYIYQIDPTTQIVSAIVASILT